MRIVIVAAVAALAAGSPAIAQEIVKVPVSAANVSRPDDLFNLPPNQWFVAKQIWGGGRDPCDADACEAGLNTGDLVISVEHAKEFVRVVAGFRKCQSVGYSEAQVGSKPGSYERDHVRYLIKKVVKGLEKTCSLKAPSVPKLDVAAMFPKKPAT